MDSKRRDQIWERVRRGTPPTATMGRELIAEIDRLKKALKPETVDMVTGEWSSLAVAGVNVFAVKLLVESIERAREALKGKGLVIPCADHNGEIGWVILSPNLPDFIPQKPTSDTPVEDR